MKNTQFELFYNSNRNNNSLHKQFEKSLSALKTSSDNFSLSVQKDEDVVDQLNRTLLALSKSKNNKDHIILAHFSDVSCLDEFFQLNLKTVSDRVCLCLFSAGVDFQTTELNKPEIFSNSSKMRWHLSELRCQKFLKEVQNGNATKKLKALSNAKNIREFTWRVQQFLGLNLNYHITSILLYALNKACDADLSSICATKFISALEEKWPYWVDSPLEQPLKNTIQTKIESLPLDDFRDYCFSPWEENCLEVTLERLWRQQA